MHSGGIDHCSSVVFREEVRVKGPSCGYMVAVRFSFDSLSLVGKEVRLSAQKEKGGRGAVGLRSEENL